MSILEIQLNFKRAILGIVLLYYSGKKKKDKPYKVLWKYGSRSPGQVAQLVKVLSQYAKVADSIPGQGTYKNQPKNA